MARGVVALRDEHIVVGTALNRLVQGDGRAHELLLNAAQAIETGLQLEVVVAIALRDCRDNGNVVALGAHVVGGGDHGNVNVCNALVPTIKLGSVIYTVLAADLRLGDDQLQRVGVVGVGNGVVQDTDGLQQVASDADLVGEVGGVREDLLRLGLELHARAIVALLLHGGLDANNLAVVVEELIHVGVQHVGTAIDGGKASEALGKLSQAIKGIYVGRLSVSRHGVDVESDANNGIVGTALCVNVVVGLVQSHRVANEVAGASLETELVVHVLHGAVLDVQS